MMSISMTQRDSASMKAFIAAGEITLMMDPRYKENLSRASSLMSRIDEVNPRSVAVWFWSRPAF